MAITRSTTAPGADDVVILRDSGFQKYFGEGGDDTVCDVGKADVVGGTGNDCISARRSASISKFDGGLGNDTIIGSTARDSIYGGHGRCPEGPGRP